MIADKVKAALGVVSGLKREIVLTHSTVPSIVGVAVAIGVSKGWIPTDLAGDANLYAGWGFAAVAGIVGWVNARRHTTTAELAKGPKDTAGRLLAPVEATSAVKSAPITASNASLLLDARLAQAIANVVTPST